MQLLPQLLLTPLYPILLPTNGECSPVHQPLGTPPYPSSRPHASRRDAVPHRRRWSPWYSHKDAPPSDDSNLLTWLVIHITVHMTATTAKKYTIPCHTGKGSHPGWAPVCALPSPQLHQPYLNVYRPSYGACSSLLDLFLLSHQLCCVTFLGKHKHICLTQIQH